MQPYRFNPKGLSVITRDLVDLIVKKSGRVKVSLDMGITFDYVYVEGGVVKVGGDEFPLSDLMELRRDYVYVLLGGKLSPVSFFRGRYFYKLYPLSAYEAPTLEISGIKMHRVVDTTPWRDASGKISVLGDLRGKRVLDVCTGLGYTAIHALRRGAKVVSIEIDPNVLEISEYNPWSRDLVNVDIILGDAFDVIQDFDEAEFDAIVHDPPRFSLAGHLYSVDFYRSLYRVLARGGRLFHYTGKVGYLRRGIDIMRGVASRLRSAGFRVRILRDLRGVLAYKN